MIRRVLPILVLFVGAVAGCDCKGTAGGTINAQTGQDGGPDGGGDGGKPQVDVCKIFYCPPNSTDAGSFDINFGAADGGIPITLDGGTAGASGNGVTVDPNGRVTLSSQDFKLNYAWIANWKMGTVSRYDTKNALPDGGIHEVGRYISTIPITGDGSPSGQGAGSVYDPSRTAIDVNGDMWVANFSSHANQYFSVTKIAGNPFNCIDRNANGTIETSTDNPATPGGTFGVIDPAEYANPINPTNVLQYDECVLFTQPLGAQNVSGAFGEGAVAISKGLEGAPGDVWVATWLDRKVFRLDPYTGKPKPVNGVVGGPLSISVPGIEPYGAAVDSKGRLWIVDRVRAKLAEIDTNTGTLISDQLVSPGGTVPTGAYGIAIDGKDRVWLPAWSSGPKASRYDPDGGTWSGFDFSAVTSSIGSKISRPRGVAVDDQGTVFMTADSRTGSAGSGSAAMLFGLNVDTSAIYQFNTAGGPTSLVDATDTFSKTSIGVGLDEDRNLWVNNSSGNVMKVDHLTGAVTKSANQAGALYTYSDFTGYQLRHFTVQQGDFYQTVAGCSNDAKWTGVTFSATTPLNTNVVLYVRGSNNSDFTTSQVYGPWTSSPANLQAAPGPVPKFKYIQLDFRLISDDKTSQPYLNSFSVNTICDVHLN